MPAQRTANPEVEVLRDNGYTLQHGRPHSDYLIWNPCFIEGGKEL